MQFLTNITNNGRKNLCGRKKKLHKILDATLDTLQLDISYNITKIILEEKHEQS
jgi:hypothetical protein